MDSILNEKTEADEKLLGIASQIDEFERYIGPHASRIALIADTLAAALNMSSRDRSLLHQASLLHDIGEMSMNREYIGSTRGLTTSELLDLHRHPVIGEQEIARLGLPRGVQLIVRWHHEWWNGGGYPDCVEGEQIPLAARILRVADSFAAITSARSFRPAVPDADAKKYLTEWAGIEFDPAVVKALLTLEVQPEKQPEPVTADPFANGFSLV